MRTFILSFLLLPAFLFIACGEKSDEESVKDTAKTLIETVKKLDVEGTIEDNEEYFRVVAPHLAYRGPDKNRSWKDGLNYDNPDEREMIADYMEDIYDMFRGVDNYTFGKIETETESEGTWYILEINIKSSTRYFAFLKVNDTFILGDID
jgi:hypothetical protein